MGFFGWLKGKISRRKELPELAPIEEGYAQTPPPYYGTQGVGNLPDMQPLPQQGYGIENKDLQILSGKIDLVNARLENLNQRLAYIERLLQQDYERKKIF